MTISVRALATEPMSAACRRLYNVVRYQGLAKPCCPYFLLYTVPTASIRFTMGSRNMSASVKRSSKDEPRANTEGRYNHLKDPGTKEETPTNTKLDLLLLCPLDYTSGRWLKNDQFQRQSRNINFDFVALCRKAVELCQQARYVTSCGKKEGGFNRVFLFRMDSGERIVARLPTPIAGPRRLTTNSEVATLAYSE